MQIDILLTDVTNYMIKVGNFRSVLFFFFSVCPISSPHPSIRTRLVFALCMEIMLLRPVLTNDNWKWLICCQVSPPTWWMVKCVLSLIILWNSWFQRFETGTVPLWSILVAHCFPQTCIVLYVLFVMHSIWIWCFKRELFINSQWRVLLVSRLFEALSC